MGIFEISAQSKKFRDSLAYSKSPVGSLPPGKRGLLNTKTPMMGSNLVVRDPRPQPYHTPPGQSVVPGQGHGAIVADIAHALGERGKKIKSMKIEVEFEKD